MGGELGATRHRGLDALAAQRQIAQSMAACGRALAARAGAEERQTRLVDDMDVAGFS
jgi:hypothetical protein